MAPAASPTAREEAIDRILAELSGDVLVTTSTIDDFASLVGVLDADAGAGRVNLLTDVNTARDVRQTFVLASQIVDLIEADVLAVRTADPPSPFSSLFVGDLSIRSVAGVTSETLATLSADADESLVEATRKEFQDVWETAAEFSARAPPYSRIVESAETDLGEEVREDLERLFRTTARREPTASEMDPVQLSLLVGARNEVQFYELGLWGESEGVASRAKFSREKQELEERDLVATEKIPTDVGRPRQRLVLGDAADDDIGELFETASAALADAA